VNKLNRYCLQSVFVTLLISVNPSRAEEIIVPEISTTDIEQRIGGEQDKEVADIPVQNSAPEVLETIEGDFSKTGRELMDEVYRRHRQYPYVYEEQSMVMVDRDGLRYPQVTALFARGRRWISQVPAGFQFPA